MDFVSAYPSIMLSFNLGIDTFIGYVSLNDLQNLTDTQEAHWVDLKTKYHCVRVTDDKLEVDGFTLWDKTTGNMARICQLNFKKKCNIDGK